MTSPYLRRRFYGSIASFALHMLLFSAAVWWAPTSRTAAVRGGRSANQMVLAAPSARSENASATTDVSTPVDVPIPQSLPSTELAIGGFTFDFRKIVNRASSLFPFITRQLEFEDLAAVPRARRGTGTVLLQAVTTAPIADSYRPLRLNDRMLQGLIDGSWSRRDRWIAFTPIARLIAGHGPNDDRVAALIRAYLDQNVLQPYVDTTIPDPRLWAMLGLSADHEDFIEFVTQYMSRHPSSKVTTELLFLLDELAQGSLDSFGTLLRTDVKKLWWTRETNRSAYQFLLALQEYYRITLREHNLPDVRRHYDTLRLKILAKIARTTPGGYRYSDALFLSGAIYWRQGRRVEAVRVWREMVLDPEDSYATVYSEILSELIAAEREHRRVDEIQINRILAAEHRRWLTMSTLRLRQFGYEPDVF